MLFFPYVIYFFWFAGGWRNVRSRPAIGDGKAINMSCKMAPTQRLRTHTALRSEGGARSQKGKRPHDPQMGIVGAPTACGIHCCLGVFLGTVLSRVVFPLPLRAYLSTCWHLSLESLIGWVPHVLSVSTQTNVLVLIELLNFHNLDAQEQYARPLHVSTLHTQFRRCSTNERPYFSVSFGALSNEIDYVYVPSQRICASSEWTPNQLYPVRCCDLYRSAYTCR